MKNNLCISNFAADFNGDGVITISDISSSLGYWLKVPGRFLIQSIHDTGLGNFFEVGFSSCDNWVSVVFSFFVWIWLFSLLSNGR
jgi:hypothetical protein